MSKRINYSKDLGYLSQSSAIRCKLGEEGGVQIRAKSGGLEDDIARKFPLVFQLGSSE